MDRLLNQIFHTCSKMTLFGTLFAYSCVVMCAWNNFHLFPTLLSDVKAKDAKGKETTAKKVREEKTNEAQAEILELELRARVLQSFLRAQEKKQLAEKATEKAPE